MKVYKVYLIDKLKLITNKQEVLLTQATLRTGARYMTKPKGVASGYLHLYASTFLPRCMGPALIARGTVGFISRLVSAGL